VPDFLPISGVPSLCDGPPGLICPFSARSMFWFLPQYDRYVPIVLFECSSAGPLIRFSSATCSPFTRLAADRVSSFFPFIPVFFLSHLMRFGFLVDRSPCPSAAFSARDAPGHFSVPASIWSSGTSSPCASPLAQASPLPFASFRPSTKLPFCPHFAETGNPVRPLARLPGPLHCTSLYPQIRSNRFFSVAFFVAASP